MENAERIIQCSERKHILHYFILLDVFHGEDQKEHPKILSSYSVEGNTSRYERVKYLVANDDTISSMIFPSKIKSFEIEEANDFFKFKSPPVFYSKYVSNRKKAPFFHCFLIKDWKEGFNEWYFNCLIFWEKDEKRYKAKAMIIVTYEPYFTLSKTILNDLYSKCIYCESTPIEPFIVNIFQSIKAKSGSHVDIVILDDKIITYTSSNQPYLQHCDLNYRLFFSYFTLKDIIFLAEQFFHLQNIIVCSPHFDILYPIYHLFISLIQPLGSTDNSYLFRVISQESTPIIFGPISFFLFAYADSVPVPFINHLTIIKQSNIIVISISNGQITKKVYEYRGKTKSAAEKPFPVSSFIQTVLTNETDELYYYELINGKLAQYAKSFDPKNNSFFDYLDSNEIRMLFFSLFTKFYSCLIPKFSFSIKYNQINYIIKGKKEKMSKSMSKVKGLIKEVSSTAAFQNLYQTNIALNHPNVLSYVLLDELIKVIKLDEKRIYFDFYSSLTPKFYTEMLKVINQAEQKEMIERYKELALTQPTFHFDTAGRVVYDKLHLFFDQSKSDGNAEGDQYRNMLLVDTEVFYYLYNGGITLINDLAELVAGVSGLVRSVIILNEITNANEEMSAVIKDIDALFELFYLTKGFNKQFNLISTLMFEIIISSKELFLRFEPKYFKFLEILKLVPTFVVYLQYNELYDKQKLIKNTERKPKIKFNIAPPDIPKEELQFLHEAKGTSLINISKSNVFMKVSGVLKSIINAILGNRGIEVDDINLFYDNWEPDIKEVYLLYYHFYQKRLWQINP